MADLHIRDKVRSIIKAKVDSENTTQDEEELLPGNNFYVSLLCFFFFLQRSMVSSVLRKIYARVNIHIHVQEFKD